jgi:hypothetical protein
MLLIKNLWIAGFIMKDAQNIAFYIKKRCLGIIFEKVKMDDSMCPMEESSFLSLFSSTS